MLPESQKQNKISITEKKPKVNSYYLVISDKFKIAKYVTLCILVAFLLTAVLLFRDEITVENLRYLFRDFEVGDNVNVNTNDFISYDADKHVNLALYKGDLVIAGSSYFYLSDLQGNKRLNEDSSFSNPVIISGEKYLLVYGLSEYTYSIYNTFSLLHTQSFDYPITNAALADNGMYAIVSRTAEYRSVVYLFNPDFECIGAVYKDKYVVDVKFNSDGTQVLITSLYSQDGAYCTEIVNYSPYSEKANSSLSLENSLPIKTGYNSKNGYSVIFDDKVNFYDSSYSLVNAYNLSSKAVMITAIVDSDMTVIAYSEEIVGNDVKIVAFDKDGDNVYDGYINGQVKKLRLYRGTVYALLEGKVVGIDLSDGSTISFDIEKNAVDVLVVNEKNILVCYSDHTSRINIE